MFKDVLRSQHRKTERPWGIPRGLFSSVLSALQHIFSNSGRTPNNIIEFLEVLFNRIQIRLLD